MSLRLAGIVYVLCLAVSSLSFAQVDDKWLPVTPQDLQIKEVPGNAGAGAILLYYSHVFDDQGRTEFVYRRIKILNDRGRDQYSDVEIPYWPTRPIHGLKARTIHPDGAVVEFSGKAFDKTLVKTRYKGLTLKSSAKAFAFPEVTVGSILEYMYKVDQNDRSLFNPRWDVQGELYAVREKFFVKANPFWRLSYTAQGLDEKPVQTTSSVSLEAADVPAFEPEELMPPESNYTAQVRFYYGGPELSSIDRFWNDVGSTRYKRVEQFIGSFSPVQAAADEAIGKETDPEKKLRRLYARAQKIRNLSFERERTQEEIKKEQLKENQNVADVLKHEFGYENEITRLFVAMARAAGFKASVVLVSDRSERFFEKAFLERNQLPAEIAEVELNGRDLYLQPGVRFCPFGLLFWVNTYTEGLKLAKDGGSFFDIPAPSNQSAAVHRTALVTLAEDGSLHGEVNVEYQGQEALQHRLLAFFTDEAGRTKELEGELRSLLPVGSVVQLATAENWEAIEKPLVAHFVVQIPAFASLAGKRLLVPASLFQVQNKNVFAHPQRRQPVYFYYAVTEADRVTMTLPAGFQVENLPAHQNLETEFGSYQASTQKNASSLVSDRSFVINTILVEPERYYELKNFFNRVQASDETQVVVRPGLQADSH